MIMTGENRRTGGRICPSAAFSTTNPIQADLESSPSLRGDSQATNPPEPWTGPPFVLHLAGLCWQTSCVNDRCDVYMCACVCVCVCVCVRHFQMWLPHVGELRVFQIGTFPSLFLTIDLTLPFRRNSLLPDSCLQLSTALAQTSPPHKQPERPGSCNGPIICLIS